ncbi:hypothetical protein C2G38_2034410 [Gigaspora rosea]|uniref:Uncharacterized protein n=1 Tax=Gigaspora rosea TaxID=44941 RepID=A0A397VJ80_9GLOM|nr:hypothetical protein C2G38_2034410 [Gigaspora rosea]
MQPYKIFIVFLLVLLIAYSTIVLSNYEFNGSELKGNKPEEDKLAERFRNWVRDVEWKSLLYLHRKNPICRVYRRARATKTGTTCLYEENNNCNNNNNNNNTTMRLRSDKSAGQLPEINLEQRINNLEQTIIEHEQEITRHKEVSN